MTLTFRAISALDPVVRPLVDRHLSLMHASSPACSVHAMGAEELSQSGTDFFALFDRETPLAIGAIKAIAPQTGEIKSMNVDPAARGRGLGRIMLDHLMAQAREMGLTRLSLETGSQDVFAPARALYAAAGFEYVPPFGDYVEDPNSVFMSRAL